MGKFIIGTKVDTPIKITPIIPEVAPTVIETIVEKIVYIDKPIIEIQYQDKIVFQDKIVIQDRIVENEVVVEKIIYKEDTSKIEALKREHAMEELTSIGEYQAVLEEKKDLLVELDLLDSRIQDSVKQLELVIKQINEQKKSKHIAIVGCIVLIVLLIIK